jgi:hypothetical protein
MRFMFILHGAPDAAPTPELAAAMHEMAKGEVAAGRMIADGGLFPPSMGAQVRLKSGRLVVTDGPFAETKEVIGGFAIFELPDLAAAIASAERFLDLHRVHAPGLELRCEIRQLAGSQVELIRSDGA